MVPLVANYLRPLVEKQGGKYEIVSTSSSTTLSWAEGDQLKQLITEHDPELVLISLGSNELFFVDDLTERAKAITAIVSEVAPRACLWVGPPAWAKDRGFLDVLKRNRGKCRYFDSTALPMQRQEDGRHPTWGASHRWAGEVWKRLGGSRGS
jgi:lysophospholipase L1-like esterase